VSKPLPTDDPKQRRPDITRARMLLNWEPSVELEQGLVKTIDYFRTKVEQPAHDSAKLKSRPHEH